MKTFKDMELIDGNLKAVWEWIGEGVSGDYDPADKDDVPLLRFSCYKIDHWTAGLRPYWVPVDDASYCTRMHLQTPRRILKKALKHILKELKQELDAGRSGKKAMESMSWLCDEDFEITIGTEPKR